MVKPRVPLQVSPLFKKKLQELQKKVEINEGKDRSIRQLTEDISHFLPDIEQKLMEKKKSGIKIKMDGVIKW